MTNFGSGFGNFEPSRESMRKARLLNRVAFDNAKEVELKKGERNHGRKDCERCGGYGYTSLLNCWIPCSCLHDRRCVI